MDVMALAHELFGLPADSANIRAHAQHHRTIGEALDRHRQDADTIYAAALEGNTNPAMTHAGNNKDALNQMTDTNAADHLNIANGLEHYATINDIMWAKILTSTAAIILIGFTAGPLAAAARTATEQVAVAGLRKQAAHIFKDLFGKFGKAFEKNPAERGTRMNMAWLGGSKKEQEAAEAAAKAQENASMTKHMDTLQAGLRQAEQHLSQGRGKAAKDAIEYAEKETIRRDQRTN
jgi:hypothetical protein